MAHHEYLEDNSPRSESHHVDSAVQSSALDSNVLSRGVSWWSLWSVVALLAGALMRLINLDSFALNQIEGALAFQGWAVYRGEGAYGPGDLPDVSPIVQLAQAFIFFVAGATDVTARLAPVAAGVGMLALVFALRPVSTRASILGMLVTLSVSPSLVYYSRTVEPPIFIAFFSMLLIVALARAGATHNGGRLKGWAALTGFAMAGTIGTGPSGISALVAIVIALVVVGVTSSGRDGDMQGAISRGCRHILASAGAVMWAAVTVCVALLLIFTRLGSDVGAIAGLIDTFELWGSMVGTRPTTTPVQFFVWAVLLYEVISVALFVIAVFARPLHDADRHAPRLRPNIFLIWFAGALILETVSSGREPSDFVLVSLPLALGAGIGLGYVLERVELYRLLSTIAAFVPLAIVALVMGVVAIFLTVAGGTASSGETGTSTAQIVFIFLILIVPVSILLARESSDGDRARRAGWAALLVLTVVIGIYSVRSASMLAYERSDTGTELLVQESSTQGVVAFADQITRLSRDITVGDPSLADPTARFGLGISISPEVPDPYRWYFREFPDVQVTTAAGWDDADVVIAPGSESMEEAGYIVQTRAQFNRVPPGYEAIAAMDVVDHIWNPSKWNDGLHFLLYRDSIAVPMPQQIAIGLSPELSNQITPAVGPFNLTDSPGRGAALGQFDRPVGITVGEDGDTVYVVDSLNFRIERFSIDGEFVGVWSGQEDPNLAFAEAFGSGPTGIATENELIYVADTWNHRVVVIDRAGQFVREIGQRGANTDLDDSPDPTQQPGLFFGPRGIAVLDGEIFVTDTGNERVQVFASDGTFLRAFGGYGSEPGQLIEPVGIAIGDDGLVYVADSGNHRLSVFGLDGEPMGQVDVLSWQDQSTLSNYLAFGPDGLLYMTAPDAGQIDVFDPATSEITLTTNGPAGNPLEQPLDVAVAPDGELLVTDGGSNQVVRFVPDLSDTEMDATPVASPVVATPGA